MEKPPTICAKQVCSSKKVTDHHAIVPTISAEKVDMASLPLGEREVLKLAARGLLRAVDEPHRYAETVITVDCAGQSFTAKGKTVLAPGWKRYEQEQAEAAPALPVVTEQSDAFRICRIGQDRKNHAAQAFHRGYAAGRDGKRGQGGYAR